MWITHRFSPPTPSRGRRMVPFAALCPEGLRPEALYQCLYAVTASNGVTPNTENDDCVRTFSAQYRLTTVFVLVKFQIDQRARRALRCSSDTACVYKRAFAGSLVIDEGVSAISFRPRRGYFLPFGVLTNHNLHHARQKGRQLFQMPDDVIWTSCASYSWGSVESPAQHVPCIFRVMHQHKSRCCDTPATSPPVAMFMHHRSAFSTLQWSSR